METQEFQPSTVELSRHELAEAGFSELLKAVEDYTDPPEEEILGTTDTTDSQQPETAREFLYSCLTPRQAQVMRQAGRGAIESGSTDARLWSKVKNSIIRHPAVIGKLATFPEEVQLDSMNEPKWKEKAACAGDVRFVSSSVKSPTKRLDLLEICAKCPVYDECMAFVDDKGPGTGIWAGVSRFKEGRARGSGYHEDGTPVTLQEERKALESRAKVKNGSNHTNGKP